VTPSATLLEEMGIKLSDVIYLKHQGQDLGPVETRGMVGRDSHHASTHRAIRY
jgi:hypothetical protein